ncbi:Putative transposase, ISSmu2 [Streptococcus thermophilus ND03]|nr:Putative transposase, ISSmu2 [Streptococcus thermophilus ND03]AFJ83483.1 Putative transposase, ISSmu2 [Streptococcus thermophilus MN-ZLW-002]AKB97473.1 Mobile element protein [Streptococcus thermophilus]AOZ58120.1 transposase [Streptococcus thermophilus]
MVFSEEIANAYKLYQLLLFHYQKKRVDEFFELIQENLNVVNHYFQTVFRRLFLDTSNTSKMH